MTLMKTMRSRNFALCPGSSIVVRERAGDGLEDEAAGEDCNKGLKQHDASDSCEEHAKKGGAILVEVLLPASYPRYV